MPSSIDPSSQTTQSQATTSLSKSLLVKEKTDCFGEDICICRYMPSRETKKSSSNRLCLFASSSAVVPLCIEIIGISAVPDEYSLRTQSRCRKQRNSTPKRQLNVIHTLTSRKLKRHVRRGPRIPSSSHKLQRQIGNWEKVVTTAERVWKRSTYRLTLTRRDDLQHSTTNC